MLDGAKNLVKVGYKGLCACSYDDCCSLQMHNS
jgi:hypothetical protein